MDTNQTPLLNRTMLISVAGPVVAGFYHVRQIPRDHKSCRSLLFLDDFLLPLSDVVA